MVMQMMLSLSTTVTLLLAVASGATATCGDLKWVCCDIPDNDPNGGTCKDDTRMACWEGFCKPCGTDGMPVCAGMLLSLMHHSWSTFLYGSFEILAWALCWAACHGIEAAACTGCRLRLALIAAVTGASALPLISYAAM